MKNTCAIFLRADPLMKKDILTVKNILRMFGNVAIILDRKWQNQEYLLSFTERADIINHEFRKAGIENYTILANDTSRYDSFNKEGIVNIAVELNNFSKIDEMCERTNILKTMNGNVNILMIPQFGDKLLVSREVLKDIILEDQTHQIYKEYISDYAYIKTKLKLMRKIGITGNRGSGLGKVLQVFKERDYDVIDLDQHLIECMKDEATVKKLQLKLKDLGVKSKGEIKMSGLRVSVDKDKLLKLCLKDEGTKEMCAKFFYDQLYVKMAQQILQSNKKVIVVSSTLLFEFKIDRFFDDMITVGVSEENQEKRMRENRGYSEEKIRNIMDLHMPIGEKLKRSNMFIDSNDGEDALVRNTVNLINYRLEKGF